VTSQAVGYSAKGVITIMVEFTFRLEHSSVINFKLQKYRLLAMAISLASYAKCFVSQSSKPNELIFNTMFYDSVCLKSAHG